MEGKPDRDDSRIRNSVTAIWQATPSASEERHSGGIRHPWRRAKTERVARDMGDGQLAIDGEPEVEALEDGQCGAKDYAQTLTYPHRHYGYLLRWL